MPRLRSAAIMRPTHLHEARPLVANSKRNADSTVTRERFSSAPSLRLRPLHPWYCPTAGFCEKYIVVGIVRRGG